MAGGIAVNDAWEYRKNRGPVGGWCVHGVWWSVDCLGCLEGTVTELLQSCGEDGLDTPSAGV